MDETDQGAKIQPARSAPPVPIGAPVRSAPSRPPPEGIARSRPRPSSTEPGSFKSKEPNKGHPEITIVSARPMSAVDFGSIQASDVKPLDRNGSVQSSSNRYPSDTKGDTPIPQSRPNVPPPLPSTRPKTAYTPPSKSRTSSVCSSSTASPVLSRKSPTSEVVSPSEPTHQDQSSSIGKSHELGKEPTKNISAPPQRPMSGPHLPTPHPPTVTESAVGSNSAGRLTPTLRTKVKSIFEKTQSGEGIPEGASSATEAKTFLDAVTPSQPPPLPTNRPTRKFTSSRSKSVEAKKTAEDVETIEKDVSNDFTENNKTSDTAPNRTTAIGELEKVNEGSKKLVPPQTAKKPPKLATKPNHLPKPTPKPAARVAFPPPPSSPKSEHKISSPLARPRPRVISSNSEEASEVTEKHSDNENSGIVIPSALSVSAAIKGLNSAFSTNTSNLKTSTNSTFNTSESKLPKPTSSSNPFSLGKSATDEASKSEIIKIQTTVDANTLTTVSKGLSTLSSTMSAFDTKTKPQITNNTPAASNWNVPDAATLSAASSGLSAMSSAAISFANFQSSLEKQPSTTSKGLPTLSSTTNNTPAASNWNVPNAATLSAASSGLSAMSSAASSFANFQSSLEKQPSTATVKTTSESQSGLTVSNTATVSAAAKGLSFLSSISSSTQSRPVAAARVQSKSQTTIPMSKSLNSMNNQPLLPQKTAQVVPSQSAMKDIASLFDPLGTEKSQQTKTSASSDLLLALGGSKTTVPARKAPAAPKRRASPTPRQQKSAPPVSQPATTTSNTLLQIPKATVKPTLRPTIIRPSSKPSNKKKAPPRPTSGPNLKQGKKKVPVAPVQPTQSAVKASTKNPNGKTKRLAPGRPSVQAPVGSGLPPRPGPGHPLFKYTVDKPHGIAQFAFKATNDDELSFEENDVIILLKEVNADWFSGRNQNKEGIFPKNFIKVIKPLSTVEKEKESTMEEITGPCAVALHAYQSDTTGDLNFNAGDNIQLLEKMDDQWYKGECNGNTGIFPKNFVEIIEDIPESANIKEDTSVGGPRCKARFDYEGDEESDLPFQEGALIKLIARIGDEWLKGELKGRTGIFPQAYVEIIQDLPANSNDDGTVTALFDFTGADNTELNFKTGDKISVKSRINSEWLIGELNGAEGSFPANFVDNVPENLPIAASSPCTVPSDISLQGTCTALFDFDAADESELSLKTGDEITLIEAVGDDWLKGKLNGKEGVFPKSFVEMEDSKGNKMTVKALFDFAAEMPDDLGFKVNDVISDVVVYADDWYEGSLNGKVGRFPSTFVEVISS